VSELKHVLTHSPSLSNNPSLHCPHLYGIILLGSLLSSNLFKFSHKSHLLLPEKHSALFPVLRLINFSHM